MAEESSPNPKRGGTSLSIAPSQIGTSVEERGAEASENETVATQIDLIINEVAKMKSLILGPTHEVAGLQGRAPRITRKLEHRE
ncbi:hypothetical protein MTO96_043493 [Rhipicephalus appendiculatus]